MSEIGKSMQTESRSVIHPGLRGWKMTVERYGLSLWGNENVLQWAVVMISQLKKNFVIIGFAGSLLLHADVV